MSGKSIKLVVSDEKLVHDNAQDVVISLVDHHLKPAAPIAARLCGGNGTCVAIIETE